MLYPYLFTPLYKNALWGGKNIAEQLNRPQTPEICSESWEVSAHPDGMSVVENGADQGKTLSELVTQWGEKLTGSFAPDSKAFPLLIKLIDASQRLSVQVHPDEIAAEENGGEAKTEMWYFLRTLPDSVVCAGMKKGVSPRIFRDAVRTRQVPSLLHAVPVEAQKAIFIPGGLVHAVCEGCLILEVQQSSNTTYRIYDWDRVDAQGHSRETHIKEAENVINWRLEPSELLTPIPMTPQNKENVRERVLRSDFFTMERFTLNGAESIRQDGTSLRVLFALEGDTAVTPAEGEAVVIPFGRSCLLPAALGDCSLAPCEKTSRVISITL